MKFKTTLSGLLACISPVLLAAPTYDDWQKKTVNVTQPVQHYGGNYQCSYNQQLFGIDPPYTFGSQPMNYIKQKQSSRYFSDSLVARPVITVFDLYSKLRDDGFFETYPSYPYACSGSVDLQKTYVEQKVIGTKIEYIPIQPFPQYVSYEYAACNTQVIREGNVYVSDVAGASNVVVSDVTNSTPQVFYSGPTSSWIAVNANQFGLRTLAIKLDNGSSHYLVAFIPQCTGNPGEDEVPK